MFKLIAQATCWFCAVGCGLMAGVYFAFSSFVMVSLGKLPPEMGIAAMNSMSTNIVKSSFMLLFLGTSLGAMLLGVTAILRPSEPGSTAMVAAGGIYLAGMLGITIIFNVPLNDALAAVAKPEANALWSRYLHDWTAWNHVRTCASLAASILFTLALVAKQGAVR